MWTFWKKCNIDFRNFSKIAVDTGFKLSKTRSRAKTTSKQDNFNRDWPENWCWELNTISQKNLTFFFSGICTKFDPYIYKSTQSWYSKEKTYIQMTKILFYYIWAWQLILRWLYVIFFKTACSWYGNFWFLKSKKPIPAVKEKRNCCWILDIIHVKYI